MNNLKKILREPLLHFVLIGAALFMLFRFTSGPAGDNQNRIVVTPGQVEQMKSRFSRTWMRSPTEKELVGLIESLVRDEVYYREAMAIGLDQNDPTIRQRMRLKMEFLLEDMSAEVEPGVEVLTQFLGQHPEKFKDEARISFRQIYLNPAKRQDVEADANALLKLLRQGAEPESVGDPTLVPEEYRLEKQSAIARQFRDDFARQLFKLAPGEWFGPLYSGLGVHLVKVTERVEGRLPELSEIRAKVEREYLAQRRQELKDLAYRKLRENYEVVVQPPSTAGGKTGGVMAKTRPVGVGR